MTKHREGKASLWQRLNAHLDNIAFYQTIFSLPFAYMAVLLASKGKVDWWTMLWVTMTIVSARSAALALDNMIDLNTMWISQDVSKDQWWQVQSAGIVFMC